MSIPDLLDPKDRPNFKRGLVVENVTGSSRLRVLWRSVTRWWRIRLVVESVDEDIGTICIRRERWCWTHWRWEIK